MVEQVRFTEARDLATAALANIGQPEDALRGQLLALRAMANAMQGDREGTADEAAQALALVATAASSVAIAVRSRMASVLAETNQFGADDWRSLEEDGKLALETGI
jgi:ATP/maltotriose-dependent transcriptional regulator MalT